MTVQRLLRNPLAVVIGSVTAGWAFLNVQFLNSFGLALWAASGDIFTFLSLGALVLPPHVPPESPVDYLVLAAGALFLAKVGSRVWEEFDTRI